MNRSAFTVMFQSLTLALLTLVPTVVTGDTHYVSTNGSHTHPFTNWVYAATNIQAAVNAASDYDEVVVGAGTYNLTSTISVLNLISIRSASGPNETIVDGHDLCQCFLFNAFGDPDPTLDGFTITRGTAVRGGGVNATYGINISNCVIVSNSSSIDGGGVHITFGANIRNCTISKNRASHDGGGVYGDLTLVDCIINCNTSDWDGGGLAVSDSSVVSNCLISENTSTEAAGGGIVLRDDSLIIDSVIISNRSHLAGGIALQGKKVMRCVVSYNVADDDGGGIKLATLDSSVEKSYIMNNRCSAGAGGGIELQSGSLRDCLITGNVGRWEGGGVNCSGSPVTLSGCTIANNISSNYGGGIAYISVNAFLTNCVIYGNQAPTDANYNVSHPLTGHTQEYYYCSSFPLFPVGIGNITNDPLFIASNDFHLAQESPCIDAGTNAAPGAYDLDGVPRPLDGDNDGSAICDMGAFEFAHRNADTDADDIPDRWEVDHALDPIAEDAAVDSDNDTFSNYQEYIADSHPMDRNDLLCIGGITNSLGPSLYFPSSSNRIYSLLFRDDLLTGLWAPVSGQTNITGNGDTLSLSDTNAAAQPRFYKIEVSVP